MVRDSQKIGPLILIIGIVGTTSYIVFFFFLYPNVLPRMSSIMSFVTGIRSNFAQSKVEIIEASGGSIIQTVDGGAVSVGPKCCS